MRKFFLYAILSCLVARNNDHNKEGVEKAMKHYDYLIKNMDADSIALLYMPDGDLGDIAHGRDSIKKFLSSFKNLSVLSQSSTTDSIEIHGDSSLQKGTYHQVVLLSGKDTVKVKGIYCNMVMDR